MATTFGYLKDVRPYKIGWRVKMKVLHAWKQYTSDTGETLELVFSDELVSIDNTYQFYYTHHLIDCLS